MTEDEAEQRGRQAHRAGLGNFPLADEAINAELSNAQPGEKTHLMAAFNRGWTAQNLAANLGEDTTTPAGQ